MEGVKLCCEDPANLELKPDHPDARKDLEVRVCQDCGNRHFELTLDPGDFGVLGSEV